MNEQRILPSLEGMIHELGVGDNDSLRHDQARRQNGASNLSRSVATSPLRPLGAVNANEAAEGPTKILNARIVVRLQAAAYFTSCLQRTTDSYFSTGGNREDAGRAQLVQDVISSGLRYAARDSTPKSGTI
jgi:hypothetical protein